MNRNYGLASVFLALSMGALSPAWADTHYVHVDNPLPSSPYTNWLDAATTIQAAIDVAETGDTILVTNGIYAVGGVALYGSPTNNVAVTNRVAITNTITVRSVNGPDHTIIEGQGPSGSNAVRCAYVQSNASLVGFTLRNGHTRTEGSQCNKEQSGGGVLCEDEALVSDCVICGNSAHFGGGTYGGVIRNCTLSDNCAGYGAGSFGGMIENCVISTNAGTCCYGGGTCGSVVSNCVIFANSADHGGGTDAGVVRNCAIHGNSAHFGGGTVRCESGALVSACLSASSAITTRSTTAEARSTVRSGIASSAAIRWAGAAVAGHSAVGSGIALFVITMAEAASKALS